MFERFTERARQVVVIAQSEARSLKHNHIGSEHLLLGLLREEEGLAARVLASFEITVDEVRAQVARIVGQGDEVVGGQIPFTPRSKRILELALKEALDLGHRHIGTEHILLGVIRDGDGVAVQILAELGAAPPTVRDELLLLLTGARGETGPQPRPPLKSEYVVKTLGGPTDTWPEQLTAWRREGWELLTVVEEEGRHRALLERRVSS